MGCRCVARVAEGDGSVDFRAAARFGGEPVDGCEVCAFEIGMFTEDLLLRCSGAQPVQNVPDGYAESANAGLSAALPDSIVILVLAADTAVSPPVWHPGMVAFRTSAAELIRPAFSLLIAG